MSSSLACAARENYSNLLGLQIQGPEGNTDKKHKRIKAHKGDLDIQS
jgi:hypothetical protein